MANAVIDGYAAAADKLIPRYDALAAETVLGPVLHLMPVAPCRVLDVGAGTGRNSAWFAELGHRVTACEPVEAFRLSAAEQYGARPVRWLDDTLPMLEATKSLGETYDFVLLSAVWQHVSGTERPVAMASLVELMAPGATLIMSVRHGPGADGRPVYPTSDDEVLDAAQTCHLKLDFITHTASIQAANKAAGVTWSWMAFSQA